MDTRVDNVMKVPVAQQIHTNIPGMYVQDKAVRTARPTSWQGEVWERQSSWPTTDLTAHRPHGPQTSRPTDLTAHRPHGPQTSRPTDLTAHRPHGPQTSRPTDLTAHRPHGPSGAFRNQICEVEFGYISPHFIGMQFYKC